MRVGLIVIVVLIISIIAAFAVTDYVVPTTWRYKITVEVKTPDGTKSGSAIREVRAWKNAAKFFNPDVKPITYEVIGEAVVVDLSVDGSLFYLVGNHDEVQNAFFKDTFLEEDRIRKINKLKIGSKAELLEIADFVVFQDLNDSQNIKSISFKDFQENFNDQISFKRIVVEKTDQPLTFGNVRSVLPWIDAKNIGLSFADPNIKDPAKYLTKESFIIGDR